MKSTPGKNYLLFISILIAAALDAEVRAETGDIGSESPKNILLICVDDLRPELNCFGVDYIHSPNIDSLAATGLRFSRFHTANSCAPTRAMLLSGNDNHIAGIGIQSYVSKFIKSSNS